MIRPSTTVFGLLTSQAGDGWLARLYNALFGFNGLDAAYVVFVVQPSSVGAVIDGLFSGGRAHHLHLAPSLWREAAAHVKSELPFVDALEPGKPPRFEHLRRLQAFAAPRRLVPLSAGPLADLLEARDGAPLLLDTSFPGEPIPRVDAKEVWTATSWALVHERRLALPADAELGPSFHPFLLRAGDELRARFGVDADCPADLADALVEPAFRPCQLLDDQFRLAYPHLEARP